MSGNKKRLTSELVRKLEEAFELDSVLRSNKIKLTRTELRLLERHGLVEKNLVNDKKGTRIFEWRQIGGELK